MTENTFPGLPAEGFVRLKGVIAPNGPIPVSRSTWWQGVKDGKFPKAIKLDRNITVWSVHDIRALIDRIGSQAA